MDSAKNQLADKLKTANNVLVSVSRNPSVDQLSALLGLALMLNKMGKHAAAVYSGQTPSTIEFLQPQDTFEKNTDSLRDFIIALDKSKADKLRYKVEDNVVRIFITPYKTSISQEDLEFSQGDFNVDVVVAIGVQQQEDLDEAITAHGRILHDATVTSINTSPDGGLGTINWHDTQASSLCELVTDLIEALNPEMLDNQIATALLTGIVAETERFSNDKTSAQTMRASASLMAAGADQQLVATKLNEPEKPAEEDKPDDEPSDESSDDGGDNDQPPKPDDGEIDIEHDANKEEAADEPEEKPVDELTLPEPESEPEPSNNTTSTLVTEPPTRGGTLTANTEPEALDPATDPLNGDRGDHQLLEHDAPGEQPEPPAEAEEPKSAPPWTPPPAPSVPAPEPTPEVPPADQAPDTLAALETTVAADSTRPEEPAPLDDARDEVSKALAVSSDPAAAQQPIEALNAQPLGDSLHQSFDPAAASEPTPPAPSEAPAEPTPSEPQPAELPQLDPSLPNLGLGDPEPPQSTPETTPPPASTVFDPTAPPPVPPPLPPQIINP